MRTSVDRPIAGLDRESDYPRAPDRQGAATKAGPHLVMALAGQGRLFADPGPIPAAAVPAAGTSATHAARSAQGRPRWLRPQALDASRRLEFGAATRALISAGQRPWLRVILIGINGLSVRLVVDGMPGAIARTRTRRHAREVARAAIAARLRIDPYAFDLLVDEA